MSDPRPGRWSVVLLAVLAAAMVWSFAAGNFQATWALWLACFLTIELWAAVNKALGDTLSERVWRWTGISPSRPSRWLRIPALALFMLELTAHFATGGQTPLTGGLAVVLTATPVGAVITYSLAFEGRVV